MVDKNYTPKIPWGEYKQYGFLLKPPFTTHEVDVLLLKQITLPVSLYRYITEVSREVVIYETPYTFYLNDLPTLSECQDISLNDVCRLHEVLNPFDKYIDLRQKSTPPQSKYIFKIMPHLLIKPGLDAK